MFLTEQEIFSQQEALEKSLREFARRREDLSSYFGGDNKRFVFFGCGSSHMIAKSAQRAFGMEPGVAAYALAGGDFLLAPEDYRAMTEDSVAVFFSRSGATSELILAAEALRAMGHTKIVTVTMGEDSLLAALSHYTLALPWAYDKSVCQSRCVTVFYTVVLLLWALYSGNTALEGDIARAMDDTSRRLEDWRGPLRAIAGRAFTDVVVLADGIMGGLAEEAALAFTEICMIPGKAFNLLDYRHGPKVLSSPATLTILVVRPGEERLQREMVKDVGAMGGTTVLLCPKGQEELFGADLILGCGPEQFPAYGLPLIQTAQILALEKALATGINPDQPVGLDPFITLK